MQPPTDAATTPPSDLRGPGSAELGARRWPYSSEVQQHQRPVAARPNVGMPPDLAIRLANLDRHEFTPKRSRLTPIRGPLGHTRGTTSGIRCKTTTTSHRHRPWSRRWRALRRLSVDPTAMVRLTVPDAACRLMIRPSAGRETPDEHDRRQQPMPEFAQVTALLPVIVPDRLLGLTNLRRLIQALR